MGKRAKESVNVSDSYNRYLQWVESSEKSTRIKWWSILTAVSVALVVAATLLNSLLHFGGVWIPTIVAFPASFLLFIVLLGLAHQSHLKRGGLTLREKYSALQRRKIGGVLAVLLIIAAIFAREQMPYAVGGTIMLVCVFGILNLLRMTDEEAQFEEEGVIDPRDLKDGDLIIEDPDILDEDFTWESYEDDEPLDFDEYEGRNA